MKRALLVLVLASGCSPQMMTPDGGGGACLDTSNTPPNLIENPHFECDSATAEWTGTIYGTFELAPGGRSGRAGKLTVTQGGGRFVYTKNVAADAVGKRYCYSAWLSGTAPFMRIKLVSEKSGSAFEDSFSEQIFSDFRRIPPQATLPIGQGTTKLSLLFEVQTNRTDGQNAVAGQTMLIDDVDVWESSNGSCTAR
jgi:hypothetical protein